MGATFESPQKKSLQCCIVLYHKAISNWGTVMGLSEVYSMLLNFFALSQMLPCTGHNSLEKLDPRPYRIIHNAILSRNTLCLTGLCAAMLLCYYVQQHLQLCSTVAAQQHPVATLLICSSVDTEQHKVATMLLSATMRLTGHATMPLCYYVQQHLQHIVAHSSCGATICYNAADWASSHFVQIGFKDVLAPPRAAFEIF